jgi:hypothetical protein
MSTARLRQQAKALIDDLSSTQLRVASEFLAFLKSRELDAQALELLAIPGFESSFTRGMKDVKAGRAKPWRKVKVVGRADVRLCRLRRGCTTTTSAGDNPVRRKAFEPPFGCGDKIPR